MPTRAISRRFENLQSVLREDAGYAYGAGEEQLNLVAVDGTIGPKILFEYSNFTSLLICARVDQITYQSMPRHTFRRCQRHELSEEAVLDIFVGHTRNAGIDIAQFTNGPDLDVVCRIEIVNHEIERTPTMKAALF